MATSAISATSSCRHTKCVAQNPRDFVAQCVSQLEGDWLKYVIERSALKEEQGVGDKMIDSYKEKDLGAMLTELAHRVARCLNERRCDTLAEQLNMAQFCDLLFYLQDKHYVNLEPSQMTARIFEFLDWTACSAATVNSLTTMNLLETPPPAQDQTHSRDISVARTGHLPHLLTEANQLTADFLQSSAAEDSAEAQHARIDESIPDYSPMTTDQVISFVSIFGGGVTAAAADQEADEQQEAEELEDIAEPMEIDEPVDDNDNQDVVQNMLDAFQAASQGNWNYY